MDCSISEVLAVVDELDQIDCSLFNLLPVNKHVLISLKINSITKMLLELDGKDAHVAHQLLFQPQWLCR